MGHRVVKDPSCNFCRHGNKAHVLEVDSYCSSNRELRLGERDIHQCNKLCITRVTNSVSPV